MQIGEVETPALVIDLDALEHNIAVVADHYRGKSIRLRPHVKNHKSPQILGMQMAAGGTVGGICAAKVSEAEAFADVAGNALIANQIVGEEKIARLAALARRVDTTVAVDAGVQVQQLSRGARAAGVVLGVVIEIDTSMGRGGVRTTQQAVALARLAMEAPNLRFRGVMSHQVPKTRPPSREQRFAEGNHWFARILEVKQAIEDAGIEVELVSTGESWTYDVAAMHPEIDEIQGGTYIVMEVPYAYMSEFRFAARVMGRVVRRLDAGTVLGDVPIDAIGAPNGVPTVDSPEGVEVASIDHHGVVLHGDSAGRLLIGDPFFLLTHQQDVTMNRWDRYLGVRNGMVETVIEATARGCIH
ncbi:MAG: alanine racemase [Gammaproteobacteria bacterium]|nr:alanine racemase [Gammaproteobacteria bacterium]